MEHKPIELKLKTTPDETWDYAQIVDWTNNDFDEAGRIWKQLHKDEVAAEEAAAAKAQAKAQAAAAKDSMNGYADYLRRNNANRAFTASDAARVADLPEPVDTEAADMQSYGKMKEDETMVQVRNSRMARMARMAELNNKIAEIQNRLTELNVPLTKKGLTEDQLQRNIAAAQMRKFKSADPTSFWRWEVGRKDAIKKQEADNARLQAEKEMAEEKVRSTNTFKATAQLDKMQVDEFTTRDDIKGWLNNLATLEGEAAAYNDINLIEKIKHKRNELTGGSFKLTTEREQDILAELTKIQTMTGKVGGYTNDQAKEETKKLLKDNKDFLLKNNISLYMELLKNIGLNTTNKPKTGGFTFGS